MGEARKTIKKMKAGKTDGSSRLTIAMIKALDKLRDEMVFSLQQTIRGKKVCQLNRRTAKKCQFRNKKRDPWTAETTKESSYWRNF